MQQQHHSVEVKPISPQKNTTIEVKKEKPKIKSQVPKAEVKKPDSKKPEGLEAAIQSDLEDSDEIGL